MFGTVDALHGGERVPHYEFGENTGLKGVFKMTKTILRKFILVATLATLTGLGATPLSYGQTKNPEVRIKDIASIQGVRSNILIGYGLMVGLSGTGDSAGPITRQTIGNTLERLGLNAKDQLDEIEGENMAAVMVTAELPPFARQGTRIDVTVSSIGDADSLEGGQLLATPLMAADGNTYAVAQGAIILGGFTAEGRGGTVTKNHTTAGRIADGAMVEKEVDFNLSDIKNLRLILKNPDLTTSIRISDAINEEFGEPISRAVDSSTVDINLPARYDDYRIPALEKIEKVMVRPDMEAVVAIDEKTGTIVMGEDVRLSTVAISHANLIIRVTELPQAVQPGAFAEGNTEVIERTNLEILEDQGKFSVLEKTATLADLVRGLNALGVNPRDVISILQTIKAAGAMQARIKLL